MSYRLRIVAALVAVVAVATWGVAQLVGPGTHPARAASTTREAPTVSSGYWEAASDGGVFAFTAPFHGSMGGHALNAPIASMVFNPLTAGYYLVASDGGVFAFTAPFHGSMGGRALNAPIVGMAFDPQTGGYYLVASDGGVFAFTAPFHGSMGGQPLNAPIVGMAFDTQTGGYWEAASDGGVFAFTAPFHGSMGGHALNAPIVGMAVDPQTGGYWEAASDGGVFAFTAPFHGSMGGHALNAPIVDVAASPTGVPEPGQTPPRSAASVCGSPSLDGPTSPPAGAVAVPAGNDPHLASGNLVPATTYWFAPGTHTLGTGKGTQISAATGDTFVGAPGAVLSGQQKNQFAFTGNATNVTIQYLTVTEFVGTQTQYVVNHTGASSWTMVHDTFETTVTGGAMDMGATNVVEGDCMTHNAQYGFSAYNTAGTVQNVRFSGNEVSYNDGSTAGGGKYDQGGSTISCGCSGGGKFWKAKNVTVTDNYVHNNGGVGIWADTDNRGFDISGNYVSDNWGEGIVYEISYNAVISGNTFVHNGVSEFLRTGTIGFPIPAVYISESGGDARVQSNYAGQLTVTGNVFTDNWGGVVLWENANRFCGDGSDDGCTLVTPAVYTTASCKAHVPGARPTQSPDYYDNCRWKTRTVTVAGNTFTMTAAALGSQCTESHWCGFNGLFSQYGTTTPWKGWAVTTAISNHQNDHFQDNTYAGKWYFDGFNQGDQVSWTQWTKGFADQNGSNDHFGPQDAGSTYHPGP